MENLDKYLSLMPEKGASDLFFSVGAPVNIKIRGLIQPLGSDVLHNENIESMAFGIVSEQQKAEFDQSMELNFAYEIKGIGRYRVNLFRQRGHVSMVVRYIKSQIPSIEELHLPEVLKSLVLAPRGLVLVVGAAGSGKSTTLASMIDYRIKQKPSHVLTIEDPVEYVFEHRNSVVDQREVGIDTLSYGSALRNAMREAPDVIMIGEIRDRETMQQAIAYAETGHLCLSTLHSTNANQTIDRIINFFPDSAHDQLLLDLSLNLKAVVSQRLLPAKDGSLVPAFEVMLQSAYISKLIGERKIESIKEAIAANRELGMQTFDQSLYDLVAQGNISQEVALQNADSKTDLSLRFRLEGISGADAGADGLKLE
jgi:twitching motility protein PilU